MTRKINLWLAVLALLLAGCSTTGASTPMIPTTRPPGSETEVVRTLVPQATPAPVTPSSEAAAALATGGYPAVTAPASALTAATGAGYPAAQPTTTQVQRDSSTPAGVNVSAPFHDCVRTPGLMGCDPQASAISARLAFFDASAGRLVALDLSGGQGWQTGLASEAQTGPAWSPDGQKLLVPAGGQRYGVYDAAGKLLESFETPNTDITPAWQADNTLSKDGSVHSKEGEWAVLEHTQEDRWLLHVHPLEGGERVLDMVGQPTDQRFLLRGWTTSGPGADKKLLAQRYYANNAALTQGGELVLINPLDGTLTPCGANMPLEMGSDFAWSPAQPGLLAFLETAHGSTLAPRLGLLDTQSGKARYPLPDGAVVTGLAWRPDGGRLALAVAPPGEDAPAELKQAFPTGGIFLLDPGSGKVEAPATAPAGTADGWPRWFADGQVLVYARAIPQASGALAGQVRARRMSDGQEWTLVDGLRAPMLPTGSFEWNRILAIGVR